MGVEEAVRSTGRETLIDVRLTPGAEGSGIAGYDAWRRRICVKVKAPPRRGAANMELVSLFASLLGVSRSDVKIVRGANSRDKTLCVNLPRDRVLEVVDEAP